MRPATNTWTSSSGSEHTPNLQPALDDLREICCMTIATDGPQFLEIAIAAVMQNVLYASRWQTV